MKLRRAKQTPPRRQRLSERYEEELVKSTAAFSYGNRRADQPAQTPRLSPRKAAQLAAASKRPHHIALPQLGRLYLAVLALMLILCIWTVSLSTTPKVQVVGADDSTFLVRDPSNYQAAAQAYLHGSLLNRNKVTVDSPGLRKHLLKQYPELNNVNVTLPLIAHQPLVYITPVQPALLLATHTGTYVVGSSGKILLLVDNVPKDIKLNLPTVTDTSTTAPKADQQVLAATQVTFIRTVLAGLQAKQINISSMELPVGSNELDVHLAGQSYFVKYNMQTATARQQTGTLLATQAQLSKQHITPTQYIDVRLNGRAYYQ